MEQTHAEPENGTGLPRHAEVRLRREQEILRAGFEAGRVEYGPLPLDFERFASAAHAAVVRRVPGDRIGAMLASTVETAFAKMALPDLFLAVACENGIAGAWEVLTSRLRPRLRSVVRARGVTGDEADEIVLEILGDLATAPADGRGRTQLSGYLGAGSLAGWLSVIAFRRVVDRARARKPTLRLSLPDDGEERERPIEALATSASDPARMTLDDEMLGRMRREFDAACRLLTPKESLALHYRYARDMKLDGIARILDVGIPRVSRILESAVERLKKALHASLGEGPRRSWPESESFWTALRGALRDYVATPAPGPDQATGGSTCHGRPDIA